MSKKYLSQDEAAAMLGMPREELTRLRERGEIRGFADRGTWKFKLEDIQNLGRTRQADSDPDVPLMADDDANALSDADFNLSGSGSGSGSGIIISGDLSHSDSDVRLIPEDPSEEKPLSMSDSDSDVKLVGDSDSDVKLIDDADSDSDVKLVGDETIRELNMAPSMSDSDSDVKLVQPEAQSPPDLNDTLADRSDSDVQLLDANAAAGDASDSDVAILSSDSAIALDFGRDAESDSVFGDESTMGLSGSGLIGAGSGISLEGPSDSGIALRGPDDDDESLTIAPEKPDSGITLAGAESGISLASDSGISLASADSGISLEAVADSGISLEDSNEFVGTVPMMNTLRDLDDGPETKFEMPSMGGDDSAFELQSRKGPRTDETGVLDLSDSGEGSLDDAVFDIDDGDASGEIADLDVADDVLGEDEEIEELDVFDADDDAFAEADEDEDLAGSMVSRAAAPVEQEWGVGALLGLSASCALTVLSGYMMMELVRSMWLWGDRGETGGLLGMVKGWL